MVVYAIGGDPEFVHNLAYARFENQDVFRKFNESIDDMKPVIAIGYGCDPMEDITEYVGLMSPELKAIIDSKILITKDNLEEVFLYSQYVYTDDDDERDKYDRLFGVPPCRDIVKTLMYAHCAIDLPNPMVVNTSYRDNMGLYRGRTVRYHRDPKWVTEHPNWYDIIFG